MNVKGIIKELLLQTFPLTTYQVELLIAGMATLVFRDTNIFCFAHSFSQLIEKRQLQFV